jgi:TrbL/VirB6 plasmid conjugal transfer protein
MDPITVTNQLFQQMQSAGANMYSLFVSDGIDLLMALGLIMASWRTLLWMLEGHTARYVASLLSLLMRTAIILFMLTTWTGATRDFFVGNVQKMADHAVGGNANATMVLQTLWGGVQEIFSSARQQASQNCQQVPNMTPDGQIVSGTHQECADPSSNPSTSRGLSLDLQNMMATLAYTLLAFAAKLIAAAALLLMGLAFVLVIQLGSFLMAFAFCLGPVLIPWFLLPPTEFLFNGWLRFTIVAGLYKVVAWLMMTLVVNGAMPSLKGLVDQIAQANGLAGADYFASNILPILALAFVSSVGAYLMWLAPGIATGLVSGTGTSATGFGSGAIGDKLRRMSGL